MSSESENNKRIAKNTAFLYLRMLLVMAVTLYTSRVVLSALGVTDFGVFNVVGGLSASFVFFTSALSNATQRYLNFGHGQQDEDKVSEVFNLCLLIYSIIAVAVMVVGVVLGDWIIEDILVIPPQSIPDAKVVLYATLAMFSLALVSTVYESVLIARENMKVYAYIGVFEAIGKLAVAYAITVIPSGRLAWYAIMLASLVMISKIALVWFCRKKYAETKIRYYWNGKLFKEIFSFAGWNIYGTAVWMANQEGINILLNIFFGPVVNAARGVTMQVTTAINNFAFNFFTSVRPQIVKRYASGEIESYLKLIYQSAKFSVFLLWVLCLPVVFRIDYVLSIWLVEVPEYSSTFIVWVLAYMLLDVLNNPLLIAIQAVGKLRRTFLYGSTWYLMAFPLSWIALKMGAPAWAVYPVLIFVRAIYLIIVFKILGTHVPIKGSVFLESVVMPCCGVIAVTLGLTWGLDKLIADNFVGLVLFVVLSVIIMAVTTYVLGMSKSERLIIKNKVYSFIKKHKG